MKGKKILTLSLAGFLSSVALTGCGGSKLANEIMEKLVIDSAYKNPEAGFSVPSKIKHNGTDYTITWSENSDYVEIGNWDETTKKVNITRPSKGSESVAYELVASVEADGKKASKSFKGNIVAYQENPIVYTKASELLKDLTDDDKHVSKGTSVEYIGVVARVDKAGTYIQDEQGDVFFVYGADSSIKVGDKVKASGALDIYYTLCQFGKGTKIEPLSRGNSYEPLKSYSKQNMTPAELWDLNPKAGDPIHLSKFKLTGVLDKVVDGKNTDYVIKDIQDPTKFQKLYYATDKDYYSQYDKSLGKKVTFDVIYYSHHTSNAQADYAYVMYDGDKTVPEGTPLNKQEVAVQDAAEFSVPNTIAANLPKTYEVEVSETEKRVYNLEYTATMKNSGDVNPIAKDGTVTIPAGTVEVKELKVKLTDSKDSTITVEKKFENLVVGIDSYTSVDEVMSKKDTNYHFMKVDVVWSNYENMLVHEAGKPGKLHYMLVQDKPQATGKTITVRGKYALKDGNHLIEVAKGDLIGNPVADETPYTFDYSKAVDLDFQALDALIAAGLKTTELETKEEYKPFNELIKNDTIVKYETYVTDYNGNKSIKYPTTKVDENNVAVTEFKGVDATLPYEVNQELKKDEYAKGEKIVVYAILRQYKVDRNDNTKVYAVSPYVLKIEKKA